MNKYLIVIAFLCMSLSAMAEDIIQVMPFATKAGATSDDMMTFNVEMTNTEDVWGVQFDLYLPEGMKLDYSDDYPPYDDISDGDYGTRYPYTSGRGGSKTYKHGVDWNDLKNGHYWFAVTPNDESFITGTSGTILTMYYTTSADMKPGIYPIIVRKTLISGRNVDVRPVDAVSYVKIGNPGNGIFDLGDYYVPSFVKEELAKEKNIIAGGECQNLVLGESDFIVENAFTAISASYDAVVSASLGYKTLVLPYNCTVPAGFKAWEVASVAGNTLNMQEVASISADKPVILEGNGTAAMNATNVSIAATGAELENAELVGTYKEIVAPVGSYVLQNHDGNVAFYEVADVQPKVGAFRAYLKSQPDGSKKMIINFGGTATAIVDAENGLIEKIEAVYGIDGKIQNSVKRGYNVLRMKDGSVRKLFNK